MKNSLIPKKHVIPGKDYWCMYNSSSVLHQMKYTGNDFSRENDISINIQDIRVMFEGYANISKSRIPTKYLVPKRHYWCRFSEEKELSLMRYEHDGSFYSISHDAFWPSKDIKVIFEDYEN